MFKKAVRIIHLWLGLLSGLVIVIVSLSGSIYAFEEEIRAVVHRDVLTVAPSNQPAKPLNELIAAVKEKYPKEKIRGVRLKNDPQSSVQINLKNKTSVYVDPYTANILGTINQETEFFAIVLKIHRELYLGKTGKLITGIAALIFTVMLISGMVLWWPSKRRSLKQKFSIRFNARWKRINYDLHSVLGFYASWVAIFIALTGLVWSFEWAESGLYKLSGSKKEKQKPVKSVYVAHAPKVPIEQVVSQTTTLYAQSKEQFIVMPDDSVAAIRVFLRFPSKGFYTENSQLFFDQYTGNLLKANLFQNSSRGDKLKATNYNIHTGKVFNLPGQLLVFFAGLISTSLPITGFLFWYGKFKKSKTEKVSANSEKLIVIG